MKVRGIHIATAMVVLVSAIVVFIVVVAGRQSTVGVSDLGTREKGMLPPVLDEGAPDAPVIELSETEVDLGTVSNKEPTLHRMLVRNKGAKPLQILGITSTCPCTQGFLQATSVNPGGESGLGIYFDPLKVENSFYSDKTLTLNSNDPIRPEIKIRVTAQIEPEFTLEPEQTTLVEFGEVKKGEQAEQVVIIKQRGDEPIAVTDVVPISSPTPFRVAYEKRPEETWSVPGRAEYAVSFQVPPDAPSGALAGAFEVKLTCKRIPVYRIAASATVTASYSFSDHSFFVPVLTPGEKTSLNLKITSDKPCDVSDVRCTSDELAVTVAPGREPNAFIFEVLVLPTATPGRKQAEVTFVVKCGEDSSPDRVALSGLVMNKQSE